MVRVTCDDSVHSGSVARVVAAAGVSRRAFYGLFENREECLAAVIEQIVALASERMSNAAETQDRLVDRMRAGLFALLELVDDEPGLARIFVMLSPAAGPVALDRRQEVLERLARVVDEGRGLARREPPPLSAEALVGGALSLLHARLRAQHPPPLVQLLNQLMSFIVLPYLGAGAARRELARPLPARSVQRKRERPGNPPAGLEMRLTYRTMSALAAIAAQPGLSNREVSERAGIVDQGQISKLLARLAGLGLTVNVGAGQSGDANAWRLTVKGQELKRTISRDDNLAAA
jgi:AcrR family transcriptional regulator